MAIDIDEEIKKAREVAERIQKQEDIIKVVKII